MPEQTDEPRGMSRREFLRITAMAGAALAVGGTGLRALLQAGRVQRVQDTRLLMGSPATLTLVADDEAAARSALDAAFARMSGLEAVFSRFRPDSQLSRLNQNGLLPDPHPALVETLLHSLRYSLLTAGVFDVTIEPVLALYRSAAKRGELPHPEVVARTRQLVDYRQLILDSEKVHFATPGMAITLDGIAKGTIIDQGAAALSARGFERVLVEVGGDMQARGAGAEGDWRIGIQSPRHLAEGPLTIATLRDQALATSGDYFNYFSADFSAHHIIDPRTGASPSELSSVSVLAQTACEADALSTSVLALGAREGLALIASLPGVEALLVTKAGEKLASPGFPVSG